MRILTVFLLLHVYVKFANTCPHGEVRLVNVTGVYQGTLEVCIEGEWSSIYVDRGSNQEAITACKQLGCGNGYVEQLVNCSEERYKVLLICEGNELNLTSCLIQDNSTSNHSLNVDDDECIEVRCLNCQSYPHQGLLPYGDSVGDQRLQGGLDVSSEPIQLQDPFPFFNSDESTIYINSHAILSFQSSFVEYVQDALPITSLQYDNYVPLILLFWTDTTRRSDGEIYYRQANDSYTLGLAHSLLLQYSYEFLSTYAFIATWHRVYQTGSIIDDVNTYQAMLVTDGTTSYVIFQYKDVQWGSGAQIGFNAGDRIRSFTVPGGLTNDTLNMENRSNVGRPGVFVYQVDGNEITSPQVSESRKPRQLLIHQVSNTSIELSWNSAQTSEVDYFNVYCYYSRCPYCSHLPRLNTIQTTQESVTVHGLHPYTEYSCCVTAVSLYGESDCSNTVTARTLPAPPSEPQNLTVVEINTTYLTVSWKKPLGTYEQSIQSYTITCTSASGHQGTAQVHTTSVRVTGLQPATNYTCCAQARTTAGYGDIACIQMTTDTAPPSEPQDITTVVSETTSLTLSWIEPAEIYGQAVQSYTINCISGQYEITLKTYNTSVHLTGLTPGTDYTCCIWAVNVAGPGDVGCIEVSTNTREVNNQVILVAAASGGALLALLAILVTVITVAVCCCYHRNCSSKQLTENQQSTDEVIYDIPEGGVELKDLKKITSTVNNTDPRPRNHDYKEEVEIRYEKPVLSSTTQVDQRKKKPMTPRKPQANKSGKSPADVTCSTQGTQPSAEKVYQPLIPPKTYKGPEASSEYQGLTFGGENKVADNSEGQYEPIGIPQEKGEQEEGNQYEPLTFGGGNTQPQAEGVYQALTKREEPNTYQDLRSVRT